jgi:nucleoside-diphosphate-sugar epimerase
MKVLITGGSGFVGLALAERLLEDGDEVCLFAAAAPPPELVGRLRQDGLQIIMGDIRSDEALNNALQRSAASRMVHAAAITPGPEREIREARTILDVNILGTVNAIERAAAAGLERVLMVSSVAVYGFSPPAASGLYEEGGWRPLPLRSTAFRSSRRSRRRCGSAPCTASIRASFGSARFTDRGNTRQGYATR